MILMISVCKSLYIYIFNADGCEKQLEIGKANGTRVEVSSFFKLSFYPWRGRLHWIHDLEPYWSPSPTDAEPWFEVTQ